MAFNLQANKVALDAARSQAESAKKQEIEQLLAKHDEERGEVLNLVPVADPGGCKGCPHP